MTEATMRTPDPRASQRGAADPGASVWVAASAGTGKTKVLTDRVLNLMLTGTPPQRILCLTFTKAAAAEMNDRIARELGNWAAASEKAIEKDLFDLLGRAPDARQRTRARQLFARVLDTPGGMNIQTLHAFCQSLLGRFPLEAGVAPHFSVLDERDAEEMMAAAREEVLRAARRDGGALAQALTEIIAYVHETAFGELMAALTSERGRLARCIDDHGSVQALVAATRDLLGLGEGETAETVTAAACDDRAFDAARLRRAVSVLEGGSDADARRGLTIAGWLAAPSHDRAEAFDGYASAFLTNGNPPAVRKTLISAKAAATTLGAPAVLQSEGDRLLAAVLKRRAATTATATDALLVLGHALLEAYQRLKRARSLLDYDDLIFHAVRLLEEQGNPSWVLHKLDGGIDHVLIDEAQDTSPEQWRIVRALTAEFFAGEGAREVNRTVFAVGDVKQSIYSFQGADPDQFVANRNWFGKQVTSARENWRPIDLTWSFRSTRAVLAAVDAVFANGDAADGVALDGHDIVHQAWRKLDGGSVEIWPPVNPQATDTPPPWKPPIERIPGDSPQARLAQLIARRIKAMTAGAERLESTGRAITAGDIMVLVRRRTVFVEELVRALKLLDVAVAGVDRMVLTEQMAVMDLVAVGRFVLLPTDDLTLATVLKGPLIGLDDEQLFRLAHGRNGTLWRSLRAAATEEGAFAAAYQRLSTVLSAADTMPPFEFYARLLGPLGGRRMLLARLGREAEDPIAVFLDLALDFERSHVASLEGFLHWLEASTVEIKRDLEQSERDAVRVMTVHGAKGLQAPIVFLPDTLQVPKQRARLLWPERHGEGGSVLLWPPTRDACEAVAETERQRIAAKQRQEYRRLLYVAMTRAKDRLIVCGWRGLKREPEDCWYNLVRDGLLAVGPAIGLQEIDDPFLADAKEIDESRVLRLTCPQEAPVERPAAVAASAPTPLPAWATEPPPPEPVPVRPLAPSRPEDDEPPVRSPFGPDDGARFKRGLIIHRLLQSLPDVPADGRAEAARAWLSRPVHHLSEEAQIEIAAEVAAVLDHPDYAALFGPGSRAEVPLTGEVNGRVISAQVDRLLVTPERVTVLDYKTHRPPPRDPAEVPILYLKQMAAYRAALALVYPERPVRCVLLWTDGPRLMPLDPELLDRYTP
jgi:ATP-dependent helicase/nuclease subunit A